MFRIAIIAIIIIIVDNRHEHKIENWVKEKILPSKIKSMLLLIGIVLAVYLVTFHAKAVLIAAAILATATLIYAFRAELIDAVKGIGKNAAANDAAKAIDGLQKENCAAK